MPNPPTYRTGAAIALPPRLASPVFVVGSPRSGTSVLAHVLLSVGYSGFREGNLFGLLHTLNLAIDQYFVWFGTDNEEVLMSRIDRDAMKLEVGEIFRRAVEDQHPIPPWFDKSGNPEVIEVIPQLLELWPDAHFIFAQRRAIENVVSRLSKFPEHSFEYHLRDWARNMRAWRELRLAMPDLPCTEIDQQDMLQDPVGVADRIGDLIGLDAARREAVAEILRLERPQQSGFGSSERLLSIEDTGWSPADVALFTEHCGPEMAAYGYTLDERYRLRPPPAEPMAAVSAAD